MFKIYSLKNDGETKITENFKVKEFSCKDGSDEVKVNIDLFVKILQPLRNWLGGWLKILSGYRTESYNLRINNSTTSQHCYGNAADIYKANTEDEPMDYACKIELWAYFNGADGIGIYINRKNGDRDKIWAYVHVDYGGRTNRYFWLNDGGEQFAISDILEAVIKIKNSY